MIPPGPLQPVYAGLFLALAVFATLRLIRSGGAVDRVGWALELAMSISMFVMVFDWGVSRWVVLQSIVFGAGAVWYLARSFGPGESDEVSEHPTADAHVGHSPLHLAHHAVMMGAMIWMLIAMIPHGRNLLGHFAMVTPRQLWAFMIGAGLSLVLAVALVALVVAWVRARNRHGVRGYDVAMTAGMLAMVAPMLTL